VKKTPVSKEAAVVVDKEAAPTAKSTIAANLLKEKKSKKPVNEKKRKSAADFFDDAEDQVVANLDAAIAGVEKPPAAKKEKVVKDGAKPSNLTEKPSKSKKADTAPAAKTKTATSEVTETPGRPSIKYKNPDGSKKIATPIESPAPKSASTTLKGKKTLKAETAKDSKITNSTLTSVKKAKTSKSADVVVEPESESEDDQTAALLKGFESSDDDDEEGVEDEKAIAEIPKIEAAHLKKAKGAQATSEPGVIYIG
jgi:nucleolar protein 15